MVFWEIFTLRFSGPQDWFSLRPPEINRLHGNTCATRNSTCSSTPFPCYQDANSIIILEWQHWCRSFYKQGLLYKQTAMLLCGETLYFFSSFRYWNGWSSCPRTWQWWSFSPRRWDKMSNRISSTRQSTTSPFNTLVGSTISNVGPSRYQDPLEVAKYIILFLSRWKSLTFIGGILGEWFPLITLFGWKWSSGEMNSSKQLQFWQTGSKPDPIIPAREKELNKAQVNCTFISFTFVKS